MIALLAAVLVAASPRAEVDALLARLEQSECRFQRNGEWYESQKARAHLEGKLAYLERWGTLESAERFIRKVASGSSMSGEPYLVQCGKAPAVKSAEWLKGQLEALRTQ